MSGWLKIFQDRTNESGNDIEIAQGKASWSRGKLDNIAEVRLYNLYRVCSLSVPNTIWHQFDRLVVPGSIGTHKPERTHQVIQAKICREHIGMHLISSHMGNNFYWAIISNKADADGFVKQITEQHLDKWITVILPANNDYPAINFLPKGKMCHDNRQISK